MSGILRLESLTKGNTLKQGDKTPLKYRLFDADGDKLSVAGKSATVRLVYPDFLTIGYEKSGLTVAQDDTVTFTIDKVIPSRSYHVEIIVDDKFIFPSRADESKFTVDKSSLGAETDIIEIVGKDVLIREVKSQVDTELQPLVTSLKSAESSRASAEVQRKIDHSNRSAELAGKADKKQEDWITPTLINGWEHHGTYGNVGYYKDDFGVVHLRGSLTNGEAHVNMFILPPGYRPSKYVFYPALLGVTGSFGSVYVDFRGGVYSYQTGTNLSLNHISFRAEG